MRPMAHGALLVDVLQCIALLVISVAVARPHGWVALAITVLALLAALTGWRP